MKKLLYLLVLLNSSMFAQYNNTIYIDPTNQGDPFQDGSINHPWDSWSDVSPQSNTAYLQKRGTTEFRNSPLITLSHSSGDLHDIYIGAYGSGERPQVHFSGSNGIYLKYTRRITIEDLELIGNYGVTAGTFVNDGIMLSGHTSSAPNTSQTFIRNCKIHRWGCGINVLVFENGTIIDTLTVDNVEIFDIGDDGIFGGIENLTVKNSHIYRVNRHWFTIGHSQLQSGGDCIHFRGNNYLIQNNILERKTTGNKFCLIYGSHTYHPDRGRILWNTFYPPQDTIDDDGGACIYISQSAYVEVAYNKFIGRGYAAPNQLPGGGAHIEADTVNFYYNLADSVNGFGVTMDDFLPNKELNFMNNTFINQYDQSVPVIITFDSTTAKNNVFAMHEGVEPFSYYGGFYPDTSNNIIVNGNSVNWGINPGFVDWQNYNYRLKENSPLVNSGFNFMGYSLDLDSMASPQQGIRDIGAFEYFDGSQTNHQPIINNQSFYVEENKQNGEAIGTLVASDPDPGQSLEFSIVSGNLEGAFTVNSTSGLLAVANSDVLDYEVYPVFNLVIQVQDNGPGPLTDLAIVTINIIDLDEPIANFSANITSVIAGESISFTNESLNNPTNLVWQFVGGSPSTSFDENPEILYNTPGVYNVRLKAINSFGDDIHIKTNYIEVLTNTSPPIADFSAGSTTILVGESIAFTNETLNNPTNFIWQFVGGSPSTSFDENPVIAYNTPGVFNVRLKAINPYGEDIYIETNYIEVLPDTTVPIANFSAGSTSIQVGESISFTNESLNNPTNLVWQFAGGNPSTSFDENPLIVYNTPGVFNVRLKAINSYGEDIHIKNNYIEVLANTNPPIANFSAGTTTIMAGESIAFYNESLNSPTNLVWQFAGGSPSTSFEEDPVITYNIPGVYNVRLKAINPYGEDIHIEMDYIEVLEPQGGITTDYIDFAQEGGGYSLNPFPNPANGYININLPDSDDGWVIINIYSLVCEKVKNLELDPINDDVIWMVDINDLPKGTYVIHLTGKTITAKKKFVKF
ncbi:MAG: PKD domain-containing protein [Bacteroidales bacterium]